MNTKRIKGIFGKRSLTLAQECQLKNIKQQKHFTRALSPDDSKDNFNPYVLFQNMRKAEEFSTPDKTRALANSGQWQMNVTDVEGVRPVTVSGLRPADPVSVEDSSHAINANDFKSKPKTQMKIHDNSRIADQTDNKATALGSYFDAKVCDNDEQHRHSIVSSSVTQGDFSKCVCGGVVDSKLREGRCSAERDLPSYSQSSAIPRCWKLRNSRLKRLEELVNGNPK